MRRFLFLFTLIILALQSTFSLAQSDGLWRHFFGHNYVRTIAAVGDTLWIGYDYGVDKMSISTENFMTIFTSNSGLNSNYVNSIQIDPFGNKWISVGKRWDMSDDYGLLKFNGTQWTVYTKTDSGYNIYPMFFTIDSSGNLWIDGGSTFLYKFDGTHWAKYDPKKQNVSWDATYSLAIDKSGNIWVGSFEKLVMFDGTNWKVITLPSGLTPYFLIGALAFDSKNNLWAGTDKDGLLKFNGSSWTVYNTSNSPLPGNKIAALYVDKKDNVWIGLGKFNPEDSDTTHGLAKFDGNIWTIYNRTNSGLPSDNVTAITGDTYGNIWIGTGDRGYAKFDGSKWKVFNSSNSSLPARDITSIIIGPEGSKWFTSRDGLSELNGTSWKLYDQNNSGLPVNTVYAVAFDSAGNKWIVTDSGLVKYDDKNWTVYNIHNSGLTENSISTIAVDKNNVKWMGSDLDHPYPLKGLFSFDGTNWKVYDKDNSVLPTNSIHSIKIDRKGNKWIVYKDFEETAPSFPLWLSGLFKYNDTTWVNYLDYAGLPIYAAEFDREGKLWVGGRGFGLTVYDGKEWTDYYRKNSSIPCDTVTTIAADSNGYVWIGTLRGLAVTDGKSWKVYKTSNSELRSDEINSLAVDDSNYLWIAAKDNFVSALKLGKDIFTGAETVRTLVIKDFSLSQNYPNPFNPVTAINYYLPHAVFISLKLYDILGREAATIEEGFRTQGSHKIIFNASSLPSGVYIYRLKAGNFIASKKLLLVK